MKTTPSRRELLAGGIAAGFATWATAAKASPARRSAAFGGNDPILMVQNAISSFQQKLIATVLPPTAYPPGVQFTVRVVKMSYILNGTTMNVTWQSTNLDGIEDGSFETTITFPANADPVNVTIPLEPMSGSEAELYTIVVMNTSNSASASFQITP